MQLISNNKSPLLLAFYIASFLILFVNSCEYSPSDAYERETVDNPTAPEIQVIELNLNEDSIFLYTNKMKIDFNFTSSDQDIIFVRFLIDGEEKSFIESSSGQFSFDNISITQGIHSLQIDVFTHSGSNSIADNLGMEGFLFSKTWILKSENIYDLKTRVETENGYLKLTFPEYKNPDLDEYIIYHDLSAFTEEIARTRSNVFIDSTYVGEGGSYKVIVSTLSGMSFNWNEVSLEKDIPVFSFVATYDNMYFLRWTKCKYYNALQSISILVRNLTSSGEAITNITDPADTVLILSDIRFNDGLYILMRSVPQDGNPYYNSTFYYQFETSANIKAGIPFTASFWERKAFPVNEDEFVYTYADTIYRCSVSQNLILESRGYSVPGCYKTQFANLMVSLNGENLIAWVGCDYDNFRSSAFDFQDFTIANMSDFTGITKPQIAISDIGTGLVPGVDKHLYLYDFVNSQLLGSILLPALVSGNREISSDGNYFFVRSDSLRYYRFSNGQFESLWRLHATTSAFYAFNNVNKDELVLWTNNVCYIKNCNDFSTIREFALSATKIFNVDFYKNQILAYAPGHLYVISLINGSQLYDVPVNFVLSPYVDECFLLNNKIIGQASISYALN